MGLFSNNNNDDHNDNGEEQPLRSKGYRSIITSIALVVILSPILSVLGLNSAAITITFVILIAASIYLFVSSRRRMAENSEGETEREENFISRMYENFPNAKPKNNNVVSKEHDEQWKEIVNQLENDELTDVVFSLDSFDKFKKYFTRNK